MGRTRSKSLYTALAIVAAVELVAAIAIDRALAGAAPQAGHTTIRAVMFVAAAAQLAVVGWAIVAASRAASTAMRAVVMSAQRSLGPRISLRSGDESELAGIAGSFSRLAGELDAALRSLAEERNRFAAVLETMAPAVVAVDDDRRITTVNRSARALLGLGDRVEGRPLIEAVRIPTLHELLDRARTGTAANGEFTMPGTHRQVQARATPEPGGGVVVVAEDVTEIRRLERIRSDFVANVSHELRTPIAVIRANAETLLDGVLDEPEAARPFVEALYRHADRIARLVAELLDISRIEAGRYDLELETVDLHELVEDVIAAVGEDADHKNITLDRTAPEGVWARIDAKAAEQVLFNLVDNAIKYTQPGGQVHVAVTTAGDARRIEIRDDGPGIDPQHVSRIFERFYRVDPGRSREMGGTGLGLSIAKHLVEAMGGHIGYEARLPRGSVFWVTFASAPAPRE